MFCVTCSFRPILSKAGCSEAAANTVRVVRAGPVAGAGCWPHAATMTSAVKASARLITTQLDADVGGFDHSHSRHSRLQAQLVHRLAGEQRDQPVWSGLDLDLRRDPVLD